MTIYVDDPTTYRERFRDYCHLWADDTPELHAFAARLGLRRAWFQVSQGSTGLFPHYDISPAKRALALTLGAEYKSLFEYVRERREAMSK